jgi:hypothetical protein
VKVPTDMVKLGSLAPKQNTREAEGVMKDQLITVMEALRVSRAEFRTHNARRVKNAPRTIQRLKSIARVAAGAIGFLILIQAFEDPSRITNLSRGMAFL